MVGETFFFNPAPPPPKKKIAYETQLTIKHFESGAKFAASFVPRGISLKASLKFSCTLSFS